MNKQVEAIYQEIERRRHDYGKRMSQPDGMVARAKFDELTGLLAFIDSLPEETCKDSLQVQETCKENTYSFTSLDEAAEKYSNKYCSDWAYRLEYEDAFIAGAEWMRNNLPERIKK